MTGSGSVCKSAATIPYSSETAGVRELAGAHGSSFDVSGPVAALLPTPEGLWAVGPGWLMSPDFTVTVLTDGPRFRDLPDALLGGDGSIWLYSGCQQPYQSGRRADPGRQGYARAGGRHVASSTRRPPQLGQLWSASPPSSAPPAIPGTRVSATGDSRGITRPCAIAAGSGSNTLCRSTDGTGKRHLRAGSSPHLVCHVGQRGWERAQSGRWRNPRRHQR